MRNSLADILTDRNAPVTPLLDSSRIKDALDKPLGTVSPMYKRMGMELAVGLNTWLKEYDVSLEL